MPDGSQFPAQAQQPGLSSCPEVDYYLRIAEVERQTGLARATIYRRMGLGTFPLAKDIGGGQRRWPQSIITAWKREHRDAEYRAPAGMPEAAAG